MWNLEELIFESRKELKSKKHLRHRRLVGKVMVHSNRTLQSVQAVRVARQLITDAS